MRTDLAGFVAGLLATVAVASLAIGTVGCSSPSRASEERGSDATAAPTDAQQMAADAKDALKVGLRHDVAAGPARADAAGAKGALAAPVKADAPAPTAEPLKEPIVYFKDHGTMTLPKGFVPSETFDLVISWHTHPEVLESQLAVAGLDKLPRYVFTFGIGSGVYERTYWGEPAVKLEKHIASVIELMQKHGVAKAPTVRRVALICWSAGYGAISRLLDGPAVQDRVDAVLIADGPHAGYVEGTEDIDLHKMDGITKYARRAVAGEKLLAISHSAIITYGYASTTTTTNLLLETLAVTRSPGGPIAGFEESSTAIEKGLFVVAFGGDNPEVHNKHLQRMGETLLPVLAKRWAEPPPAH